MTEPYPQFQYGPPNPGPPPENNLIWAILCTVLCCLPFGIVAIVKANEVNSLWYQGYHDRARESADAAKKWAMWGAISQVIVLAVVLVVYLILFLWVWQVANQLPDQY